MVGGRDYGESQFNRATDALRQPGSSFKPFVYATAMMNGFTPNSIVRDAPICIGNWCPHNYGGGYSGPVTLTTGAGQVDQHHPGPSRPGGRPRQDRRDRAQAWASPPSSASRRSLPLGASEVTVIDMAGAYAVFANGGYKATPYAFTQIINGQGDVVYDRRRDAPPPERVLDDGDRRRDERHAGPGARMGHRPARQARRHQHRRQDRHDHPPTAMPGSSASPATTSPPSGSATTAIAPTRRLTGGMLPAQTWNGVHDLSPTAASS